MADRITKEQRSINMSRIRGSNTKLEISVRKFLFNNGFRYRINQKTLPGRPDIVLPKYKTVIFVNGCFWHHHENCKKAFIPKTNTDFWIKKFEKNVSNDKKHYTELSKMGYQVLTVWECRLKDDFYKEMSQITDFIKANADKS